MDFGIDLVLQIGNDEDDAQRLADVIRFFAPEPPASVPPLWEARGKEFVSHVFIDDDDNPLLEEFVFYLQRIAWKEPHKVRLLVHFPQQPGYQIHRIAVNLIQNTLEDEHLGKLWRTHQ